MSITLLGRKKSVCHRPRATPCRRSRAQRLSVCARVPWVGSPLTYSGQVRSLGTRRVLLILRDLTKDFSNPGLMSRSHYKMSPLKTCDQKDCWGSHANNDGFSDVWGALHSFWGRKGLK
jgi:hypothetical protein